MATDTAYVYELSMHAYFIKLNCLKHALFVKINKNSTSMKACQKAVTLKNNCLCIYLILKQNYTQSFKQLRKGWLTHSKVYR